MYPKSVFKYRFLLRRYLIAETFLYYWTRFVEKYSFSTKLWFTKLTRIWHCTECPEKWLMRKNNLTRYICFNKCKKTAKFPSHVIIIRHGSLLGFKRQRIALFSALPFSRQFWKLLKYKILGFSDINGARSSPRWILCPSPSTAARCCFHKTKPWDFDPSVRTPKERERERGHDEAGDEDRTSGGRGGGWGRVVSK